jgi:hypothetical protein
VRLFQWSSENHHLGRADGAVRLIDRLHAAQHPPGSRVLLWGHSHAGNVFALMTHLLAADLPLQAEFFRAAQSYYRWPLLGRVDIPVWQRVQELLERAAEPLGGIRLDIVTFGTPIRYGWDQGGYARLLHFVHHRPRPGLPEYRVPYPPTLDELLQAAAGDYVQQLGIAGTNFPPHACAWRSWLAERQLARLLQPDVRRRDLLARLAAGARVPEAGTTLLVDYGNDPEEHARRHLMGHTIYTRSRWLPFHTEQIADRFYGRSAAAK